METIELDNPIIEEAVVCRLSVASTGDIAVIESQCNRPPWSQDQFRKEFDNQCSRVYGARVAGALVGFLVVHVVHDEAHIVNFGVDPQMRGRGYGKALLVYVLRDLFDAPVKWVTLEVRSGNKVARGLYEGCGFNEVGLRERYYSDNQEDGVVLKLNLQQFVNQFGADADSQAVA